jgi:prophage regulatory protein
MHTGTTESGRSEMLLRLPSVIARVGLKKSTLYEAIKRNEFPAPLRLGRRAVCWPSSAIDTWIAERIRTHEGRQKND